MIRHDELQDTHLRIPDDLGVREDFHPFPDFGGTCCQELFLAHHFHGAEAAAGFYPLVRMIAEMGNINIDALRRLNNLRAFWRFHGNAIDFQMNHSHLTSTSDGKGIGEDLHGGEQRGLRCFS